MSTQRWQQLEQIFAGARHLPAEAQREHVARACGADETLRRDAMSLLAADVATGAFIDTPALEVLAKRLAAEEGSSLRPGERVGAYTIVRRLGSGGAGEVWRATDERLGREVAIKVLLPHFSDDPERLRRFADEARAAGALNHANILTVYDVGENRGLPFLVCECLEGQTLRQQLERGPVPAARAAVIALGCAQGLAAAHARGIIHRDLKPENTFIRSDGGVKILDFGLAKLESAIDGVQYDGTGTIRGVIVGTPGYMAPEQVKGERVDARTDLFALGVMLYEMVSGRHPFFGASSFETLHAVLTVAPPDLSAATGPLSAPLTRIVMRLLNKTPDARFQSALDLAWALEQVVGRPSDVTSPVAKAIDASPSWRRRPVPRLVVSLATALVLLTAAAYVWRAWPRGSRDTPPSRAVPLTTVPGVERYPSFSPDGDRVAYTWNGPRQNNRNIYVQQIGAGSPLRLTMAASSDDSPAWSPDGRWIAFLRDHVDAGGSELRLIAPLGGPERKLGDLRPQQRLLLRSMSVGWCPDSTCIVVTDSAGEGQPDALFVVSLESGEKRQLTYPQHPVAGDTDPAVSPDGRWLVFRRNASPFIGELYRLPLGRDLSPTGDPSRLTPAALDANNPTWMPDSREILFSAKGGLWRLPVSGTTPARLPFVGEDGGMPVVSRRAPGRPARLVYVHSYADSNIWRVETSAAGVTAGSAPTVAISSTRVDSTPQLSPDGRRVAFTSNRSGALEIWLSDLDGSNAVQLTSMGAVPGFPRWSPDGALIAFHSNPEGQADVYVIPAAGGRPRNLTAHPGTDVFPAFSQDGRWIYFSSNRSGGDPVIWKAPLSGGDAVRVTGSTGNSASESLDGADLYYNEAWDRPSPVWRLPASGGVAVKVLEGVVFGNFTVLERGIYYIDRPSGTADGSSSVKPNEARLQYVDFASGRSRTVAPNLGNVGLGLTASRDGRTIFYSRVDAALDDLMLVEDFR